jgi:surfeit locus 1 family protein
MPRFPLIPTVVVLAAVATMIALGFWQLGRLEEKEALIAEYQAAQANKGFQFLDPALPEAAYTRTIEYCSDPQSQSAVAGRNARGQSGWVHVVRCSIGGAWPETEEAVRSLDVLHMAETGVERQMTDAEVKSMIDVMKEARQPDSVLQPADLVLGWSQSPETVSWQGGFVAGTVVPSGELGIKIVADPPLAGLMPNARPDPTDLPNNHLAYAVQWFLFAATAAVIFVLALRRKQRDTA